MKTPKHMRNGPRLKAHLDDAARTLLKPFLLRLEVSAGGNPMKHDPATPPTVARWPFYLGDIILLGIACISILYGGVPLPAANVVIAVACTLAGIGLLLAPYLLEYEAKLKIAVQSSRELSEAQAKRLVHVAEQLNNVVSRSQSTEEQAGAALGNLEELSDKLAAQIDDLSQAIGREKESNEKDPTGEIRTLLHERGRQIEGLAVKLSSIEKALIELAKREASSAPAPVKPPPVVPAPAPEPVRAETKPTVPQKSAAEPEPEPEREKTVVEEAKVAKTPKPRATPEPSVPQSELEFSPKETGQKTKSNGNGGSTTALVATAYIGIGNKLFLRGEGPGLSWDKGQLMEFLAIGKWGWKTTDASAPVSCKIYRNDEAPMLDDNIVIDPGERAEIAPRF
jgi:hypothetical protein